MLGNAVPSLLQHVRRLAAAASSDEQLLADFLTRRSDEAFAALVGRHGPMVFNVCRRILHDAHAAEDVFQATFLVLAGRAGAIRRRASLAGFLHGVAYRLAVRARRRRMQGLPAAVCDKTVGPSEELAWKEMLGILDHELGQLSDRYRAPLVLCYLEGRTQDEAARQLGWSLNTLRRRLAQARRLLEVRLRRRGVTLPAALAGLLAASAVGVPGPLRAATLAAAGARAVGGLTARASALFSARKEIALFLSASGKKVGAFVVMATLAGVVCFAYCWLPLTPTPLPRSGGEGLSERAPLLTEGGEDRVRGADPLLAQGTVRLGTAQYRHGMRIESFVVSADGRLAAVASGWGSFSPARVFDLTNGRCLYSLPHEPASTIEAVGLSPDGKTLATKDDKFLSFRDAATGKELRKIKYLPDSGGSRSITSWLTFTPDGQQIAATLMGTAVHLIDVETGAVKRTFAKGAATRICVFSTDGKLMATGGYEQEDSVYYARLWEVATGKEVRRFAIGHELNQSIEALALSHDGTKLVGGSWGDGRLRLFEVATGKELKVFPKIGNNLYSVAFAPDGRTVAAAGDSIHLYDLATRKERLRIERQARGLAFNRDGSILTGAVSGAIYRWDAVSGRQLSPAAGQDSAVEQIVVRADGRRVFTTDQDGDLYIWDTAEGKPPRRIVGGAERGIVPSPDGRLLAWIIPGVHGGSRIRLYDVAGEQVIDRFPTFPENATVAAFLPDGKTLLTLGGRDATVRLWDVESSQEQRSFPVVLTSQKRISGVRRALDVFPYYTTRRAALAPDSKTLALGLDWQEHFNPAHHGAPIRLWDVATGKAGHELQQPQNVVGVPDEAGSGTTDMSEAAFNRRMKSTDGRAFSPDGRFLADWAQNPFGRSRMDHVYVWDAATGRVVATLDFGPRPGARNAAFAPDGRTLATASADGIVRLWEVATWKVRAGFRGHRDRITALAFNPDGRLFTGGLDTVVLGWDVRPPQGTKGTLAEAWKVLANSDARVGFQAQGRFLAEPGKAVEWFAARLTPVRHLDPARVKALIADLDKDDFATRERATAELKEHWPATAAALRAAVAKPSSLEARRRAEGILREMEKAIAPPDTLRALRAAEILEWIATKEARALLLKLAKGALDARLTLEAAAACKRLEARK